MAETITFCGSTFTILFPDLMPAHSADELRRLEASMRIHGIIYSIVVDESNGIIDGINRLRLAAKIGLDDAPIEVRRGLTHEQKRALALSINLDRRHLTAEQTREIIAAELRHDPEQSNRQIAAAIGVDHKTVAAVREQQESTGEIPQLNSTKGKDGKKRKRRTKQPKANGSIVEPREPGDDTEAEEESKAQAAATPDGKRAKTALSALGVVTRALEHFGLFPTHRMSLNAITKDLMAKLS